MHRTRDFDLPQALPGNAPELARDLELETVFGAMARGDAFLLEVASQAVLSAVESDPETIRYRQEVLRDCLSNEPVVRSLYAIAVAAIEKRKKLYWHFYSSHPGGVLYGALEPLQALVDMLERLRRVAEEHAAAFGSEGFAAFFGMLEAELPDEYLATVRRHLKRLRFPRGVLVGAALGPGNQGADYVLREPARAGWRWDRLLASRARRGLTFHIHERDLAGARALTDLRDRGINEVANAVARSAEHVLGFFTALRTELAFYIGCVNLHRSLAATGAPVSFPTPAPMGSRRFRCAGLYDVCLALATGRPVVGNDLEADARSVVVITGANEGGKSTLLRAVGVAQLMMQCGMFVAATALSADVRRGLFTHFQREEDAAMESGRLEEDLRRASAMVDALTPEAMVLLNESFAATNERDGSKMADQFVHALMEAGIKVFFVTHLYEFSHALFARSLDNTLFLRAERRDDGQRTFRLIVGEPLRTSFGVDLYEEVFGPEAREPGPAARPGVIGRAAAR